jgi:hypothetical protein
MPINVPARVERYRLPAFGEKRLEDGCAISGEDARGDFYLMVEARVGEDFEAGADGAAFGIVGAVDEPRDTGLDNGAGAHAAWLDGDVERGIRKTVVAKKAGCFAKDDNFGMGRRVIVADSAIAGTSQNLAVVDENSADGDFTGFGGEACFCNRFLHEGNIGFHAECENSMRMKRNGIYAENVESIERGGRSRCLTIGEGGNTLGACENSWNACFKWIF